MIKPFNGPYRYSDTVVRNWNSAAIGVYYCGYITADNKIAILYVGKGVGDDGIRGRLLDHLRYEHWPDVTHFGFHICDFSDEAERWESEEIALYKPKYNKQGK